ncbi:MAG: YkgJ family cysteine cluster protein [Desulfovibrio sp.]|nr:YkgJ family cysteine cluster protein [Desulfovibrio sp.]
MTDELEFPDNMPCIGPDDAFRFACGPEQPCFNRCCAQLSLPLTPYDALRLTANLGLAAKDFLAEFTGMRREPGAGFPMFHLRMLESPDAPCPFVSPGGCSVYEDRPGACRSYPLGRGARLSRDGITERFFMVREEHCRGFDTGREWTPRAWFRNQGLERYSHFNDRYMRLMSMVAASGRPLDKRLTGMALLCLWQLDSFAEFLAEMRILSQLELADEQRARIMSDPEERLDFGLSWLELVIFGEAADLALIKKSK